jgi:hypothetical protein
MDSAKRGFQLRAAGGFAAFSAFALAVALAAMARPAAQQTGRKTFTSAAQAGEALVAALEANDQKTLLGILGPDAKDILSSGDPVEDASNRAEFIRKYRQMHRLVAEPDGNTTLYIGAENWPTPIPLVESGGAWHFNTAAGRQEILFRRIGRNELAAIQVCHELVDAEKEYYATAHDGGSVHEYARKFFSDPDRHDGLYWPAASSEEESPIGPLVASAAAEGYRPHSGPPQQPFQGYYYRLLAAQGANEPGGVHSYIVDGRMTGGFAFVAFPAQYRSSGVVTFLVDQNGVVYEKDLGPRTEEIAKTLIRYDRDTTWRKAE